MLGTNSITNTNSFKSHTGSKSPDTIIIPILYRRKPKHREDK